MLLGWQPACLTPCRGLLSPPASSNTQPPGEQRWVGERVFLWAGGGGRDLEKEPQGQEGRWRCLSTMEWELWETKTEGNGSERPFLFPLCAFTSLRKDSRVPRAHQGCPTPSQCSTVEESEELVRGHSSPQGTAAATDKDASR